ncbi:C40 family peptidase [Streptomyces sp. NPDC002523]
MAPERDEVRQRIDSLYDRAENATGNFNATRAMAVATRRRGAPPALRQSRPSDPALDAVARQWFDAARAKLGPTVPATLPADRLPDTSVIPARNRERADICRPGGDAQEITATDRPALPAPPTGAPAPGAGRATAELTEGASPAGTSARPRLALETGGTDLSSRRPATLPARRPAELPAGRPAEPPVGGASELPPVYGELPVRSALRPAEASPAESLGPGVPAPLSAATAKTTALPVPVPQHHSPADSKADVRRKLVAARDLLSRHTARLDAPPPAPQIPPAQDTWPTPAATVTPTPEPTPLARAARAIAFARAQIGKPCVWGATGPDSYDCSSLTQGAWRAAGVTLPRAAHQQALAGTPVTLESVRPGDLVLFFDDDRHVGLYVGDGMMVHAPGPGSSIREESVYGAGEKAIHRVIRPA